MTHFHEPRGGQFRAALLAVGAVLASMTIPNVAMADTHEDLVRLFTEWRAFETPVVS